MTVDVDVSATPTMHACAIEKYSSWPMARSMTSVAAVAPMKTSEAPMSVMAEALRALFLIIVSTLIESPMMNIMNMTPRLASTSRFSQLTRLASEGVISPSAIGPSSMPTSSSPMIDGNPSRSAIMPSTLPSPRISSIHNNKVLSNTFYCSIHPIIGK